MTSIRRNCGRNEVRERNMLKKEQLCLFKSFCSPIFTYNYGAEFWIWTKADVNRLVAAVMRFLGVVE